MSSVLIYGAEWLTLRISERVKREEGLRGLADKLVVRERDLTRELARKEPDMARVAVLKEIIGNIRHTLDHAR